VKKQVLILGIVTLTGTLLFTFLALKGVRRMIAEDKDYLIKREKLRPLQLLKGERPFTEEEMKTLRESVRDISDFRLRCRALTALSYIQDPQQRKEAIELAIERLKDSEWVVRQYALWALGNLDAKESIPQILPLLNDPNPMVRKQAKKTLQKLGYQVRE